MPILASVLCGQTIKALHIKKLCVVLHFPNWALKYPTLNFYEHNLPLCALHPSAIHVVKYSQRLELKAWWLYSAAVHPMYMLSANQETDSSKDIMLLICWESEQYQWRQKLRYICCYAGKHITCNECLLLTKVNTPWMNVTTLQRAPIPSLVHTESAPTMGALLCDCCNPESVTVSKFV